VSLATASPASASWFQSLCLWCLHLALHPHPHWCMSTHTGHTLRHVYTCWPLTQVTHTGYMLAHSTYADLQQPLVHADTRDLARSHVEATRLHEVCVHTRAHTPRAVCTSRTLLTPPYARSVLCTPPPTHKPFPSLYPSTCSPGPLAWPPGSTHRTSLWLCSPWREPGPLFQGEEPDTSAGPHLPCTWWRLCTRGGDTGRLLSLCRSSVTSAPHLQHTVYRAATQGQLPHHRTPTTPPRTWQHAVHRGGDVDILQVLQRFRVEEAKGGPRGEGDPNSNASHGHVGDDHPFLLMGLQLALGSRDSHGGQGCCWSRWPSVQSLLGHTGR
jgi:hypothetical protein